MIRGASGVGSYAFAGAEEGSATSALASAGDEIAVTVTPARGAPESCMARERGQRWGDVVKKGVRDDQTRRYGRFWSRARRRVGTPGRTSVALARTSRSARPFGPGNARLASTRPSHRTALVGDVNTHRAFAARARGCAAVLPRTTAGARNASWACSIILSTLAVFPLRKGKKPGENRSTIRQMASRLPTVAQISQSHRSFFAGSDSDRRSPRKFRVFSAEF